jgi:hypothetical protein
MVPRSYSVIVPVLLLAAGLSACSGDTQLFSKDTGIFSNISKIGTSSTLSSKDTELDSTRPVTPEDFVDASGQCAFAIAAEVPGSAVGTPAGDLATAPAPAQPVLGGIGLGMTECQVAQRAGQSGKVDIGADETGERKVVLTYLSGPWPGIYNFVGGRLKEIVRVAEPPPPPKPVRKKNPAKPKPKTAAR